MEHRTDPVYSFPKPWHDEQLHKIALDATKEMVKKFSEHLEAWFKQFPVSVEYRVEAKSRPSFAPGGVYWPDNPLPPTDPLHQYLQVREICANCSNAKEYHAADGTCPTGVACETLKFLNIVQ